MAWVDQTMNYCSLDARFAEGGVSMEDFGHGEPGHTIVIEPLTQEDAHSYAFILRKCAQHLERVGRGLPEAGSVNG
jgi:hypothetical protein